MLKQTIKYTNYNGEEETGDFYFYLSKADLLDIRLDYPGGIDVAMTTMMEKKDVKGVINVIRRFIDASYGEKSEDGHRFEKSPEILNRFKSTEAYSTLVIDLLNDMEKLDEFITRIMPADVQAERERQKLEKAAEPKAVEAKVE